MDFNYIDPKFVEFHVAPDDTLRVVIPGEVCGMRVEVLRAMPLTHPEHYIVLRDGGGKELGILRDLRDLPFETAEMLRELLHRRYFLPQITRIIHIYERFGTSVWNVETDRGPISITTRAMQEAVHEMGKGRYMLSDVESNRYEIPDINALDDDSQARFLGKM